MFFTKSHTVVVRSGGSLYWTFFIQITLSLLWKLEPLVSPSHETTVFAILIQKWNMKLLRKICIFLQSCLKLCNTQKKCLFLNSMETFSPKKCIEWPQAKSRRSILVRKKITKTNSAHQSQSGSLDNTVSISTVPRLTRFFF